MGDAKSKLKAEIMLFSDKTAGVVWEKQTQKGHRDQPVQPSIMDFETKNHKGKFVTNLKPGTEVFLTGGFARFRDGSRYTFYNPLRKTDGLKIVRVECKNVYLQIGAMSRVFPKS